jgi:hypothetical protein
MEESLSQCGNRRLSESVLGQTAKNLREHISSAWAANSDMLDPVALHTKKKGRLRCHKRPKSREETPKEGSGSGIGLGAATA